MKIEIPNWMAAVVIVLVLLVAGWFLWQRTGAGSSEKVVPKTFGSESNPFGNQPPPTAGTPTPQGGGTASGP